MRQQEELEELYSQAVAKAQLVDPADDDKLYVGRRLAGATTGPPPPPEIKAKIMSRLASFYEVHAPNHDLSDKLDRICTRYHNAPEDLNTMLKLHYGQDLDGCVRACGFKSCHH